VYPQRDFLKLRIHGDVRDVDGHDQGCIRGFMMVYGGEMLVDGKINNKMLRTLSIHWDFISRFMVM